MFCEICGHRRLERAKFCHACGHRLPVIEDVSVGGQAGSEKCQTCDGPLDTASRFCSFCWAAAREKDSPQSVAEARTTTEVPEQVVDLRSGGDVASPPEPAVLAMSSALVARAGTQASPREDPAAGGPAAGAPPAEAPPLPDLADPDVSAEFEADDLSRARPTETSAPVAETPTPDSSARASTAPIPGRDSTERRWALRLFQVILVMAMVAVALGMGAALAQYLRS